MPTFFRHFTSHVAAAKIWPPLATFLLLALAIASIAGWAFRSQVETLRETALDQMQAVAQLKIIDIARWLAERRSDALAFAHNPSTLITLAQWLQRGEPADQALLLAGLRGLCQAYGYRQVTLLTPTGQLLLAATQEADPLPVAEIPAVLEKNEITVVDLHRHGVDGPVSMGLLMPLFALPYEGETEDRLQALLYLTLAPEDYLYPYLQVWPLTSRSGEVFLFRQEGEHVLHLTPLRYLVNSALRLRLPMERQDSLLTRALRFNETRVLGLDYRDVPVFAAVLPVPNTSWHLVAKVDETEAMENLQHLALITGLLSIASLLVAVALMLLFWQRQHLAAARLAAGHMQALQDSEARFRSLFEQSPVAYQSLDAQGRFIDLNPPLCKLLGYSAAQLMGRLFGEVWAPAIKHRFPERFEQFKAGGSVCAELQLICGDGRLLDVLLEGRIQRDAEGQFSRTHCVLYDITERKQNELQLRQQGAWLTARQEELEEQVAVRTVALRNAEARLRLILDSSADGLYGIDKIGHVTFINPAACAILGYSREQLLDRPLHQWIHHRHADGRAYPAVDCPVLETLRNGKTVRVDHEVYWHADGHAIPVIYAARPLWHEGNIVGAVVSFVDITTQREAEQAREAARREAERLVQTKNEFLANMSHEIRTPLNAILGLAQVGLRDSSDPPHRAAFERIMEAGRLLLGIIDDILDFAKIEAGKLSLEIGLVEPGNLIDRALDLNVGRAESKGIHLALDEAADLPLCCQGDGLRLMQILVNLLSNAIKFTAPGGQVTLAVWRTENELLWRVSDSGIGMTATQLARLFTPFEQADGSTTRRFGGTGLGLAISQRLAQLMGGAIHAESQYHVGSHFTLRLPLREVHDAVAWESIVAPVILAGLDPEEAQRLITALAVRGISSHNLELPSALVTPSALLVVECSQLVNAEIHAIQQRMHQGQRIAVACYAAARFRVPEPLREHLRVLERPLRARHVRAALQATSCLPAPQLPQAPRLAGLRILAAEDNEVNSLILEDLLTGEGAKVTACEHGRCAVDAVRINGAAAFDLVLMDIQMPEMGGYEATQHLLVLAPSLPIIGLTAHALPEERARCLAAGMREHVAKPVDLNVLVAAIRRWTMQPKTEVITVTLPPLTERLNWVALEAHFRGKRAFVDRLAAMFLSSQNEVPERLRQAIATNDYTSLAFIAHSLKGMAGNLLLPDLQRLAQDTEKAARAKQPAIGELAEQLAGELEALLVEIRQHVASTPPNAPVQSPETSPSLGAG